MSIRPFVLLLAAASVAPAFSQFTSGNTPPVFDSRDRTPAITAPAPPPAVFILPSPGAKLAAVAQARSVCYAIRSYEFSQPDSSSETPKITATSTCQAASTSHLRATVLSPPVNPQK